MCALMECNFYSEVLGLCSSMNVILPQKSLSELKDNGSKTAKYPVLFLLHGLSDDHTIWLRRTSIERYVENMGLAVVMPSVHRSFYTDMKHGLRYWTYISEEIPAVARSFFPLSDLREDNFVAGLSMGGYGTFKLVMSCPDRFAAGASLSGAMDIADPELASIHMNGEYENVFGNIESVPGSKNDLFYLAEKLAGYDQNKPKLFQCCGTEDFLYKQNIKFRDHCRKIGLDLTFEEENGIHEWGYWDKKIRRVLEWLPLEKK